MIGAFTLPACKGTLDNGMVIVAAPGMALTGQVGERNGGVTPFTCPVVGVIKPPVVERRVRNGVVGAARKGDDGMGGARARQQAQQD